MGQTRRAKKPQGDSASGKFLRGRYYSPEIFDLPPAKSEKDAQTSLRLPQAMYNALATAALEHGVKLGEEMRLRLEASFVQEAERGDEETDRLVGAITTVARNIGPAFGAWHQNRFAFDTFRAGVLALIDLYRPRGEPVRPSENEIADMYLGEDGTPETAARMIAGGVAVAAQFPLVSLRLKGKGR